MKKTFTTMILLFICINGYMYSQIKEAIIYTSADITLGSGTGADLGDAKDLNFGGLGTFAICNFDANTAFNSPMESWAKFDISSITDSIPEGYEILYAEIVATVAGNASQGFNAYHLFNADDWIEGTGTHAVVDEDGKGMTWTMAQAYNYEDPDNYSFITSMPEGGATASKKTFNVTDEVLYELSEEGNGILTIRFEPYINDPEDDSQWLGYITRESPWDLGPDDEFHKKAMHIIFTIGPAQPTQFSDNGDFGSIKSYESFPDKFGYWTIGDEGDGDNKLMIAERPGPINKTPGAVSVYKESYGDFELSLDAKVPDLSAKTDFCIVFGYVDALNYKYVYLIGNDDGGIYQVDNGVGSQIVEQATAALVDDAYHTYKVSRAGNSINVSIDGAEYISASDDAFSTEGKVGVGSYNDLVYFDNIVQGTIEPAETNFEDLNATITSAKEMVGAAVIGESDGEYNQEVVDALNTAIAVAETVAGTSDAIQSDVDAADEDLQAAVDTFQKSANGIYIADLSAAIDEAQIKIDAAVEGFEGGQYDEGAKAAFQNAIDAAKAILENVEATQDEVDTAKSDLNAAEDVFDAEINSVGIETASAEVYKIYPIPVTDILNIYHESDEINTISVCNAVGQIVIHVDKVTSTLNQINISNLKTGMYFVQLNHNNGAIFTKKIVKQ